MTSELKAKLARILAGLAGALCVIAGLLHHGFGMPILDHFLSARSDTPPALMQQIQASWTSATLSLIFFGAALVFAAFKRPSWLSVLAPVAGVWLAAYAAAEQLGAARWGRAGLAPEALILCVIALIAYGSAFAARPKQP